MLRPFNVFPTSHTSFQGTEDTAHSEAAGDILMAFLETTADGSSGPAQPLLPHLGRLSSPRPVLQETQGQASASGKDQDRVVVSIWEE